MKLRATPASCTLILGALAACRAESEFARLDGTSAMRSGEMIRGAAIENAIVSQRTLYPYHFVAGSPELNELGRRDFSVLARHIAGTDVEIILAQGDATPELFLARAERVAEDLEERGVPDARARLVAGVPGGEGISGARLVKILARPSGPIGSAPTVGGAESASSAGGSP